MEKRNENILDRNLQNEIDNANDPNLNDEQESTEKTSAIQKDASVTDPNQETPRNEENIEKSASSKITSNFSKKHGRTNHSLGAGHEPGTLPGGNM
ncbi:MAG: hypothetical protein EOO90_00590 [Pedobacter sp.]|nr:MAG: hypothetical protein EOO90_00590 [Pedobacter sp.]